MEKKGILILPQTPIESLKVSKYIPPIIASKIATIFNGDFHYCINTLDSFNNREKSLNTYIDNLNKLNIKYNDIWIDSNNIDKLLENIYILIEQGYISEIETSIYVCDCKKIEIEQNKISTCNPNITNFYVKDGNLYSKCCNSICKKINKKVLVFTPKNIKKDDLEFFPKYLNNDSKTYESTVLLSYITISRERETGIKIKYNGTYYNLDIDFLWSTYLANFEEKQKIVISGNKMMYQLFVVGLLEKILKPENRTILLGLPILLNADNYFTENIDPNIFSLALEFNMKWKNKNTEFDNGILRKLYKTSPEIIKEIKRVQTLPLESNELYAGLNEITNDRLNSQKILKKIKCKEIK